MVFVNKYCNNEGVPNWIPLYSSLDHLFDMSGFTVDCVKNLNNPASINQSIFCDVFSSASIYNATNEFKICHSFHTRVLEISKNRHKMSKINLSRLENSFVETFSREAQKTFQQNHIRTYLGYPN